MGREDRMEWEDCFVAKYAARNDRTSGYKPALTIIKLSANICVQLWLNGINCYGLRSTWTLVRWSMPGMRGLLSLIRRRTQVAISTW